MNYARIYNSFIASRRSLEPGLLASGVYTERHHIVPRSLGGDNRAENLINLTAGDHYFAHLCLAKIYGGQQWSGVFCMANLFTSKQRYAKLNAFSQRKMVQIARQKLSEINILLKSGKANPARGVHGTIYHKDGRKVSGYCTTIAEQTGISIPSVYRLLTGQQGRTHDGWFVDIDKSNTAKSKTGLGARFEKGQTPHNVKQVLCVETGNIFNGTREAEKWAKQYGNVNAQNIRAVCSGKRKTAGGYRWAYA